MVSQGQHIHATLNGAFNQFRLLVIAAAPQGAAAIVGASIFGATALGVYLTSTLYHALAPSRAKRILRIFDHCAIYLLIAGTYTPFTLGVLRGPWGWSLFGVVWGVAAFGVTVKLLNRLRHPLLSTALYVAMGWVAVVAVVPLVSRLPAAGLAWLVAGGLGYTLGAVVFHFDGRLRSTFEDPRPLGFKITNLHLEAPKP